MLAYGFSLAFLMTIYLWPLLWTPSNNFEWIDRSRYPAMCCSWYHTVLLYYHGLIKPLRFHLRRPFAGLMLIPTLATLSRATIRRLHALLCDNYVVRVAIIVRKDQLLLLKLRWLSRGPFHAILSLLTNGGELFDLSVGVEVGLPVDLLALSFRWRETFGVVGMPIEKLVLLGHPRWQRPVMRSWLFLYNSVCNVSPCGRNLRRLRLVHAVKV